jgi:hypothetical protein
VNGITQALVSCIPAALPVANSLGPLCCIAHCSSRVVDSRLSPSSPVLKQCIIRQATPLTAACRPDSEELSGSEDANELPEPGALDRTAQMEAGQSYQAGANGSNDPAAEHEGRGACLCLTSVLVISNACVTCRHCSYGRLLRTWCVKPHCTQKACYSVPQVRRLHPCSKSASVVSHAPVDKATRCLQKRHHQPPHCLVHSLRH